ncbi:MAG: thioredoxin domain-containing protein [Bacteriovoracaceae bacterium]|nr:thioredoxin domain-containing protein [Bacteriovoracaceae bacterium]
MKTEENKIKLPYVQLIITLLGLGSSFWTYLLHIQLKAQAGSPLICDVNETINCSKIIGSSQGELFYIPLGIWGMVYWLMGLGLVFLPKFSKVSARCVASWRLFVSGVGFVSALALIYISYFILKGICEFCSVVQASCIIYFIVSFVSYKRIKDGVYHATKLDFIKFVGSVTVSLVIPLVVFASTKTFFHNYYKKIDQGQKQVGEYQIQAPFLPLLDNENIDYSQGENGAPVEIIEFTDFECPYCQLLHEKLQELKHLVDSGKVRIYFRNWPLSYHKYSFKLAVAARCSGAQDKFWEFADWSFKTAKKYARDKKQKEKMFSDSNILNKAKDLNLDITAFKECLKDENILKKLKKDSSDANYLGGAGTPFLLVNGSQYKGNWLQPKLLEKDILKIINGE